MMKRAIDYLRQLRLPMVLGVFSAMLPFSAVAKPNILFIFADDYAYDCLHAHGNKRVETPHLDKLSGAGTHFTHAYNSGAWHGAVCVASRTMMMTGRQVWNAHNAPLAKLVEEKQFLPQLMQQAGYETYFSGKWHVGSTGLCSKAWNTAMHIRPGMPNQVAKRYKRNFTPGQDNWDPTDVSNKGFWKGGKHWSEVLADDAELMIEKASKQEKPFMMMLCFNAPHDPRQAPAAFQKKYPYDSIQVPENFQKEYPYNIGSNKVRDEKLAPFPRTPHSIQVNRSEYYALISHMDQQIGRIIQALKKSGKYDNTVIIFSADHGLGVGQHGLLGKQNMYDHSVRVPWMIAGPGIPAGKKVSTPIYLQDAMATCLDLAGVKKPKAVEFNSVIPLLKEEDKKRDIYSCYVNHQRMVTDGEYKLIVYPLIQVERLYHTKSDPLEKNDLAKDSKHSDALKRMRVKLVQQMKAMNDPLDIRNPAASYKDYMKNRGSKRKKAAH